MRPSVLPWSRLSSLVTSSPKLVLTRIAYLTHGNYFETTQLYTHTGPYCLANANAPMRLISNRSSSEPQDGRSNVSFAEPDLHSFSDQAQPPLLPESGVDVGRDQSSIDTSTMTLRPEFPNGLPQLPEIHSAIIKSQVFTHRSYFARPTHVFEDDPSDPSPDNEMLEYLGDAVLSLVVTGLLREMYRNLRVGPATKIRSMVVGNATLADISCLYQLPDRIRTHPAQSVVLKSSTGIQADLFESYIGGLYVDQGLDVVKNWLNDLLMSYVHEAYRVVRKEHGLPADPVAVVDKPPPPPLPVVSSPAPWKGSSRQSNQGHLALFNQRLQQRQMFIEWVFSSEGGEGSKSTPMWCVRAMQGGECIASGRGSTKKSAKHEAAREGLLRLDTDEASQDDTGDPA